MTIPYTEHLRADGAKMADAAAAGDLDAHVPSCPEWNVAKLIIHTGHHHRWVADAVSGGGKEPAVPAKPGLREEALIDWFRQGWTDLADLLDRSDDATPAWSWSGDNRVGFWRRRTALETLVHRWDAENAVGTPTQLDDELAADGVDEVFAFMMQPGDKYHGKAKGRVLFEIPGHDVAWLLDVTSDIVDLPERVANSGSEDADVVLRAQAGEMLLYLWGRKGRAAIEHEGDADLFSAVESWLRP